MKPVRIIGCCLVIIITIAAAIIITEARLRYSHPNSGFQVGRELGWLRRSKADLTRVFTVDPDFGFRPVLGNTSYNKYGTLNNKYSLEPSRGVARLLFIGDSITARGKIINALKHLYGEDRFEYWNAGVESFNTTQEVNFYKRYNSIIKPDHVILTFVYNDFGTTPIAFFNQDNKLVVYELNTPDRNINPWLFEHSYVYRFILGKIMAGRSETFEDIKRMGIDEVRKSLQELRELLDRNGIAFTVLVLPKLKPPVKWKPYELEQRDAIIRIVEDLNIRYFDLFDVTTQAIKEGVPGGERRRDHWHPGPEISMVIAKYLFQNKIMNPGSLDSNNKKVSGQ
jgi:hypothetical protein